MSLSQTRWWICEVAFCPLLAWEQSWGFVGADTLLLCVRLSRLHTEVWEAVCRCGSQHQLERRACDRGTFRLVQGGCRGSEEGGLGLPPHIQQTDGEEISRKSKPPEPGLVTRQFPVVSVSSQGLMNQKDKTFITEKKKNFNKIKCKKE